MMIGRIIQIKLANNSCVIPSLTQRSISIYANQQSSDRNTSQRSGNKNSNKIGFVGTGKIAQAIIAGLIKKELFKPEQIFVSDANLTYLNYLKEKSPMFQVF